MKREQQNMKYEDLLSRSRDLLHIIDDFKVKAHADQMAIRVGKSLAAKLEQQIYDLRFVQETLEKEVKNNSSLIEEYHSFNEELKGNSQKLENKLKKAKEKMKIDEQNYSKEIEAFRSEVKELKEKIQYLMSKPS